jgi:hypothetical protein
MLRHHLYFMTAIVGGILTCAGCGNSNGVYPVSGKVLYKGEPAKGAIVYFHRKSVTDILQEHTPQGVVEEDGTFTLVSPLGKGALPGEYVVLIEWKEGAGKGRGRNPALAAPDRLRGRYMNPKKPQFQVEVKTEKTQLTPFELR